MRARSVIAAAAALATVAFAGCGSSSPKQASSAGSTQTGVNPNAPELNPAGDIPDNQAYVAYSPPGSGFSVKVPEGWARTEVGGAVSFTDKLNRIRMQSEPATGAPSVSQARAAVVPKLAGSVTGFKLGSVSAVSRSAGPGVRVTYLATSVADPVTGKTHVDAVERYSFFHGNRNVILTLSGPKGADNVDPWKIVTDSLRFSR